MQKIQSPLLFQSLALFFLRLPKGKDLLHWDYENYTETADIKETGKRAELVKNQFPSVIQLTHTKAANLPGINENGN